MPSSDYKNIDYKAYRKMERSAEADPIVDAQSGSRIFLNRVYNWMFGGLMLTALTAGLVVSSESVLRGAYSMMGILIIAEFALVFMLSLGLRKMSPSVAGGCFIAYAVLNGVTLSPIFFVYTKTSVFLAFGSCALMFGATSMYGYMTKKNLDSVGSYCMMGLFGLIIASLVNLFLRSSMGDLIISYIGIALFLGLTVYDTQKIKQVADAYGEEAEGGYMKKAAIMLALQLYLDFINLFLYIVRIMGKHRD